MFFLGHMTWAYVWGRAFTRRRSTKLFVPAVLMFGVLPDIDLFLRRFGVVHHTFTHSFLFWFVVFAPFLVVFQLKAIPYLAAVVQHFAFGDFLVGSVTIFWPFSRSFFGFNIPMPSVLDATLEVAGLLLAIGVICLNGDLRRLLSTKTSNVSMFLPSLALLASMLVLEVDAQTPISAAYSLFQNAPVAAILLAHIVLAVFLAVSTIQGLRGLVNTAASGVHLSSQPTANKPSYKEPSANRNKCTSTLTPKDEGRVTKGGRFSRRVRGALSVRSSCLPC